MQRRQRHLSTALVLCSILCAARSQNSETTGNTAGTSNQRHFSHNRAARHEARLRASLGDSHGNAYRASQAAAATANTYERGQLDESKEHWTGRNDTMSNTVSSIAPPQLELVVARSNEKLEWLAKVPLMWQITILNRGGSIDSWLTSMKSQVKVVNVKSTTSDSESFAAFLVDRYYSLAGYTVFSPAKPLQYNWRFLELLQTPTKFGTVQALAGQGIERGSKMKTDRISTRTLNSVLLHNPESVNSAKWFSKDYNLTWGQNLIKKYFDMIGLENWMDERQEVGSHAIANMLGFERSRANRHSKQIYEALYRSIPQFGGNHHVVDKIWLMMFGGSDFSDVPL